MKKSALRCLILTCLLEVALCGWNVYVNKNKTWSEARNYCRAHYTDLSSISNLKEDENLQQYSDWRFHDAWIGLHKDGWNTRDSNTGHYFYCFQNTLVLVKENKTWEEAMEQCREQHKDLVSLSSESALVETLNTSKEAQTDRVWTGLRYLADDWLWVSGEHVSYQPWSPTETPQCPAWTHHCGALSLEGKHLESWDCADKLNFVCERNMTSLP